MKRVNAETGPKMTLTITDAERAIARQIKDDFKIIIKKLDNAIKTIVDLRDAIVSQRPTKEDLNGTYRGRLLRYRRKIKVVFNEFLSSVKSSLEKLSKISDPEMISLREIIIAEIDELTDGVEVVLDTLSETDREGFTNTLERVVSQIEKRQKSIIDVIDSQLYGHIDQDILGRMKISELKFRIRRRARIIKQLCRGI